VVILRRCKRDVPAKLNVSREAGAHYSGQAEVEIAHLFDEAAQLQKQSRRRFTCA